MLRTQSRIEPYLPLQACHAASHFANRTLCMSLREHEGKRSSHWLHASFPHNG